MIIDFGLFCTLYLNITNQCNLNCEYCYIHDKKDYEKVASLGNLINAIDTYLPQQVVITGGEPLLYPELIQALLRHYDSTLSRHWDVILCTNLYYKELSKAQLDAIKMVDYIQTSYSIDRTKIAGNILDYIKNNTKAIKEECKNIGAVDCIFTITQDQLTMNPGREIKLLLDTGIDSIDIESISYNSKIDVNWQKYYDQVDDYVNTCCEFIPYDKNALYQSWDRAFKENLYSMNCNMCSFGCAKTYDNGKIFNRCNCLVDKEERKIKFMSKCIDCDYYTYCKMDCERYGNYCGFLKKTFSNYLNKKVSKE